MRTRSLAIALIALASTYLQPCPAIAQILVDEGNRYGDRPSILPEEIPQSAAEEASPSVPLQDPAMPDGDVSPLGRSEILQSTPAESPPGPPGTGSIPPSRQGATIPQQGNPPRQQAAINAGSPAATNQPATRGAAPFSPRTSAKDLLADMLSPPEGAELEGAPLSLPEAMEGVYGSDRQREIVAAYWDLAVAVAKYYTAYGARPTSPESGAELIEAKLTAVRAQHRLAEALQWTDRRLPLPLTQPHSGSYNTRFDEIFVGTVSRRAWELDQTLPLMYDLLKARAEVFAANRNSSDAPADAQRFLDAVREYNLAIAEYALLAAGDTLTGRDLVPLLIRVERGGEEEEHVAGADEGLGKTSSRPFDPRVRTPRRAVVDPRVVQTAGERPAAAPDRSVLNQPRQDAPVQSQPSIASPTSDQWRERDPSETP